MTYLGYTPVTQRIEGYPYGECVRASYAALFGVPIDCIPRFDPAALAPGESQHERERKWLQSQGLDLVEFPTTSPPDDLPEEALALLAQEHLISGISPRGLGHRCVGRWGQVLWDPHPSRAGLVSITSVGFVVPLDQEEF